MSKKKKSSIPRDARTQVLFNTGTRVHKSIKGKGSYRRSKKVTIYDDSNFYSYAF